MIQALGLLLCGVAAVGMLLAASVPVLVACWVLGAVLLGGLIASAPSQRLIAAAREAFLVEIAGGWALAVGGLTLAIAPGNVEWAGIGVVLAVVLRLGLPPCPWWPARVAGAPAAVRVFLLGGLHPATALLLWRKVDLWLQPWHVTVAVWFGVVGSLLAILAAAGERHAARRAAWLGISFWGGLLAAGQPSVTAIMVLAVGLVLVQLQAAMPRWPALARRALLLAGGGAAAVATLPTALDAAASVLRLLTLLVAAWVLLAWLRELGRPGAASATDAIRRAPLGPLAPIARLGQQAGSVVVAARATVRGLSRVVTDFDRVVLAGVGEGLGWITLGVGWFVTWIDRRGLDGVDHGFERLFRLAGRGVAAAAGGQPGWVLGWAVVVVLGLALAGSGGTRGP